MDDVNQLREQAERCFRLARGIADSEVAAQLEALGRECLDRADAIERDAMGRRSGD